MTTPTQPMSPELEASLVAKNAAEAAQFQARAALAEAEAAKLRTEASHEALKAAEQEIELRQKQRIERELLALDGYNYTYRFTDPVSDKTVSAAIDKLTFWRRTAPENQPLELVFNSPGGSVIAGMDLFDFILELRRDGHFVTTATRGMAASMGGILLQAGDRRVMGHEAYVLIHEVATGTYGKIGEIEDEVKFMKKIGERVIDIFLTRAAGAYEAGTATKQLTRTLFTKSWERKDWWLNSNEALELGVVDELR
jgi:ATP-dependent Clp endopeptidase proteolytic subunit ClpP